MERLTADFKFITDHNMEQQGASLKLSFMVAVVLVAFASYLSPFIVEARQKHARHNLHRHHRVRYSPIASPSLAPTTAPALDPTTAPSFAPTTAPSLAPTTAPALAPSNEGMTLLPASAPSNEGMTFSPASAPPQPLPPISLLEPSPSESPPADDGTEYAYLPPQHDYHEDYTYSPPFPRPPPGYVIQYIPHGCGYGPCVGANDCDYPCPVCCSNHTCCAEYDDYEEGTYPGGPPGYP